MIPWLLLVSSATAAVPTTADTAPGEPTPLDAAPVVAAPAEAVAWLVGLSGTAVISVGGAPPVPLTRCAELPADARLCTDADSYATVRLAADITAPDAQQVVLMPRTCVDIDTGTAAGRAVRVEQGSVDVPPRTASAGPLSIRTRDGSATGKAGGFRVSVEPDATRTEAVLAEVALATTAGSLVLAPGTGSRMRADAPPEPPHPLLRQEGDTEPGDGALLTWPDFRWSGRSGVLGWRVELATDEAFADMVQTEDVAEPRWQPALLFAPTDGPQLWWRVAPYDRFGFLGVPSAPASLRLPTGLRP